MTIKMSEVFESLPTTPEKFWLSSDPEIRQKQMQALVHAINQHDKLVEENQRLAKENELLETTLHSLMINSAMLNGASGENAKAFADGSIDALLNRT